MQPGHHFHHDRGICGRRARRPEHAAGILDHLRKADATRFSSRSTMKARYNPRRPPVHRAPDRQQRRQRQHGAIIAAPGLSKIAAELRTNGGSHDVPTTRARRTCRAPALRAAACVAAAYSAPAPRFSCRRRRRGGSRRGAFLRCSWPCRGPRTAATTLKVGARPGTTKAPPCASRRAS